MRINRLFVLFVLLLGQALALAQGEVASYSFKVVNTYPHDPKAFTQGLVYYKGFLYEGTGLNGASELRKVELKTGKVLQRKALAEKYFGEGIVLFEGKIYQLTWKNREGFIYDLNTFNQVGSFNYDTEGWGFTQDGKSLILSDGSERLYFLNPKTLKPERSITVTLGGKPINNLNELEYIGGKIYANIWQTTQIVIVDPKTGVVEGVIDLRGLSLLMPAGADVLNGIAYDGEGKRLFVTGKLWPMLFEIELVKK